MVALLVAGDWLGLERFTSGRHLSAGEIESAVRGYGRTLTALPEDALASLDVVEVEGCVARTVSVRVPLWTLEEGRSDLEVDLTLREVMRGVLSVEVDDLHVA